MSMDISPQQIEQEAEYSIPYHYLFDDKKLIAFPEKLFITT